MLGRHLEAAKGPDGARIEAYLKDLSSETFTVREQASEALRKLGELAERPLRKALETKLDLETRRRVELLLSDRRTHQRGQRRRDHTPPPPDMQKTARFALPNGSLHARQRLWWASQAVFGSAFRP